MKKTKTFFAILVVLLSFVNVNAQWMGVGNPQEDWWFPYRGNIEDAEFVVQPQGLYMGVDMYLTFSGRGSSYNSSDTIEFYCEFDLPEGSFFVDSWLWLNDDILVAELMDRWTASSIYNEIVGRRQDPSILYKTWRNNYELRIYPMQGDSTRKVKLSYLTPFNFNSTKVSAQLPFDLLAASQFEIKDVRVKVLCNEQWKNPTVLEYPNIQFEDILSADFSINKEISFDSHDYEYPFTLQFDSPMKDGVFFNYLDEEEDYYQIAVLPSVFIDSIAEKKIVIALDYEANYRYTKQEVYSCLKNIVSRELNQNDYVNIMLSSTNIEPLFDNWVQVKDLKDELEALDESGEFTYDIIKEYSNLPTLLHESMSYIVNNEGTDLYLIANSENDGDPKAANDLINDLKKLIKGNEINIHIANFMSNYDHYYFVGNVYYSGNEYLYINLTKLIEGNYKRIEYWNESLDEFLLDFSQKIDGAIKTFDLHTSVENGFCYSRLDLKENSTMIYLNQPIMHVGKYFGDFPFTLEVAGLYNDKPFVKVIELQQSDVYENDTMLEEIWAGNYIEQLEASANWNSNDVIRDIIDYSIEARVLSTYTAFLAIEPGAIDSLNIDEANSNGPGDDEIITNVEDKKLNEELQEGVKTYPNPFKNAVTFEFEAEQNITNNKLMVNVYNIAGKLIYTDEIRNIEEGKLVKYVWDGVDNAGSKVGKGTYFVVFESASYREVAKVIKL